MPQITEEDTLEFAKAMAQERPPTNKHLIQRHIDWWHDQDSTYATPIISWYKEWIQNLENDKYIQKNTSRFDSAYQEFTGVLDDLEISY